MANSVNIQTILDGPRNVVVKVEGLLDTSDLGSTTLVDPALLTGMDNTLTVKAAKLRIMRMHYNVEDALEVRLVWDATTAVRVEALTGRGKMDFCDFGGLVNNAGAGVTGKLLLSTEGWSAGKLLSFTLVVELVKQQS
jgi:hypothetical protein